MQSDHKRFHLGIFGGSGCGKTTLARRFLCNARAKCVFIFDPDGEFARGLGLRPVRRVSDLAAAVATGWVCFDPHIDFPGDLEKALAFFADFAFQVSGRMPGRKFFVVDEVGLYVTTANVPKELKIVVQTGRRHGLDGIFMAQQPNEIHNTIRSQLSTVICFQLTDVTALKFPEKFGFNPREIMTLKPYRWVCRDNQGQVSRG